MPPTDRWLVLVHQLPARPDALRAKIGRRLARLGAVAVKNSVYLLPNDAERAEDLAWLLEEIVGGGGEGTVIAGRLVGGLDDDGAEALFRAARDAEAAPLVEEARGMLTRGAEPGEVAKLRRRNEELAAIDFFGSPVRAELDGLLAELAARRSPSPAGDTSRVSGRTWVTRRGVKVDRIASAWLIRRHIDPGARLRFVDPRGYTHADGELRFDMTDGEYTHEGEDCTFEVLVRRFALTAPGLGALAEVIHDIDLKDARFGRPEAAGVAAQIDGIAALTDDDEERIRLATPMLDALTRAFGRPRA